MKLSIEKFLIKIWIIFNLLGCSAPEPENQRHHNEQNSSGNTDDKSDDAVQNSTFEHPLNLTSCKNCHEKKRPEPPHPIGDCIACHTTEGWSKVKSFSHEPMPATCNACHNDKRPQNPHTQEGDCVSCHQFPSFANVKKFDHQPPPASCVTCHNKIRPAAPHEAKKDCVECHTFPSWEKVAAFSHVPKPASCNSCHEKKRPVAPHVAKEDCASCHSHPDWKKVNFSHIPKPTNCERCHTRPTATYSRAYPNQGPPAGFNRNNPKELGSGHLVGLDCAVCHRSPAEGAKTWNFNHNTPTVPYCLPCHYNDGRAEHGTSSTRYNLTGFGNCYNCHKNFKGKNFDN